MGLETTGVDCRGVVAIWAIDAYHVSGEFRSQVDHTIQQLLFSAKDRIIKEYIMNKLFVDQYVYTDDPSYSVASDFEIKSVLEKSTKGFVVEEFKKIGLRLHIPEQGKFNSSQQFQSYPTLGIFTCRFNSKNAKLKLIVPQGITELYSDELMYHPTQEQLALTNEISILKQVSHKNIVSMLAYSGANFIPLFAMLERISNEKTLEEHVINLRGDSVTGSAYGQLAKYVIDVCEAVKYLSSHGILHRDICAANAMVTMEGAKLCNFSLAVNIGHSCVEEPVLLEGDSHENILVRWSAPESLTANKWSPYSERWMIGALAFEVFSLGQHPFPEVDDPARLYSMVTFHNIKTLNILSDVFHHASYCICL